MLLHPLCPGWRGPLCAPSRHSHRSSTLGAHSAPDPTTFSSYGAEEACLSGDSRAIYTNRYLNESRERKGGKNRAEALLFSLDLFSDVGYLLRGPCRGSRASLCPSSGRSLPPGPHLGLTVADRSLQRRIGFLFQMELLGLSVLFLTRTKLFDLHSLHGTAISYTK